jgi:hypothetical protein
VMADILLLLSKLVEVKKKRAFSCLDKVGRHLMLAIVALVLFGWTYVVVSRAIIALEFAQYPSAFVP